MREAAPLPDILAAILQVCCATLSNSRLFKTVTTTGSPHIAAIMYVFVDV